MKFAELIKTYRTQISLNQTQFADKVQVTKTTVSNWETGKSQVEITNTEVVDAICETLNISKTELLNSLTSLEEEPLKIHSFFKKYLNEELLKASLSEPLVKIFVTSMQIEDYKYKNLSSYFYITSNPIILCAQIQQIENFFDIIRKNIFKSNEVTIIEKEKLFHYIVENQCNTFNIENLIDMLGTKYLVDFIASDKLSFMNKHISRSDLNISLVNKPQKINANEISELILNHNGHIHNVYLGVNPNSSGYWYNYCRSEKGLDQKYPIEKIRIMSFGRHFSVNIEKDDNLYNELIYDETNGFPLSLKDIEENFIETRYIPKDEIEAYNKEVEAYELKHSEWESKMSKIREIQSLYSNGKEKYPDIPEPQAPVYPEGRIEYIPNRKLETFVEDYLEIMKELEPEAPAKKEPVNPNYRTKLVPYINSQISFNGVYSGISEPKGLLFKDIYRDDEYICDHLWILQTFKDCYPQGFEGFIPGERYVFEGTVDEYTKDNQETNIGVSEVKLIKYIND